MATADDYASLIDPTGEAISTLLATPHSLPQGERCSGLIIPDTILGGTVATQT